MKNALVTMAFLVEVPVEVDDETANLARYIAEDGTVDADPDEADRIVEKIAEAANKDQRYIDTMDCILLGISDARARHFGDVKQAWFQAVSGLSKKVSI